MTLCQIRGYTKYCGGEHAGFADILPKTKYQPIEDLLRCFKECENLETYIVSVILNSGIF
jgi:hypothetical protein